MIRNAIIHITNEQPLVADLYVMPTAADNSLVCTNVRTIDGKRPIFVDHSNSVFTFPYLHIRFIEILAGAAEGMPGQPEGEIQDAAVAPEPEPETDLELDEDFLRRIREV